VKELLAVDLSKEQQCSDWGAPELSERQLAYAANDVAYLHRLKEALDSMLAREGRTELARACFDFLPARVETRSRRLGGYRHFCPLDRVFVRSGGPFTALPICCLDRAVLLSKLGMNFA